MKKLIVICLSVLLPAWLFAQQAINFTASIDHDSINVDEIVVINYKIEGTDYSDFQLPEFEGFRIVSGPFQSTSIQYINGKMSRETSYSFKLLAVENGTFFFPPATIMVGEDLLETETVKITVVGDGSAKPIKEPQLRSPSERPTRKKPKTIYSI